MDKILRTSVTEVTLLNVNDSFLPSPSKITGMGGGGIK